MTKPSKKMDLLAEPVEIAEVSEGSRNGDDDLPVLLESRPYRQNEGPLVDALWLLWGERRSIARIVAVGLIISLGIAFLMPPHYHSTTSLMPPDTQSGGGMMAALLSKALPLGLLGGGGGGGGDVFGFKNSGALFQSVLRSRTVEDRIIDRFNLMHVYKHRTRDQTRRELEERTEITQDRLSGVISITVDDTDAARSVTIANAYVEQLGRLMVELDTSSAHRERVFLEDRLKTVQLNLEDAEKDFSQFASKNMAIDIKEQGKAMVEAAATLQGELIAAESELEGLRQIYADSNVRVRSLEARISELKQQLEKVGGKGEDTTAGPDSPGSSLYPSIKKLPLLGVTYADMYRRTKVQEAAFEVLTQQYELAKVQEAKEVPSVRVLDTPQLPERRSSPTRSQIVLVGILCSVFLAIAWVLFRYNWDQLDKKNSFRLLILEIVATGASRARSLLRKRGGLRTQS